jgi:prephenate dehydrogenase
MLHITLIGMGLIGTSFGMALRTAKPGVALPDEVFITGYDQDRQATNAARGRLAIDRVARSLAEAVQQAQIIIIATPVQEVRQVLIQLAPLLNGETIVTDTASTKTQVCAWARELLPAHVHFIGGHPMAGSEQSGAHAATPDLFHQAIYCLTPDATTQPQALHTLESLVRAAGAKPYYIDPIEHDAYVAGISHLPLVLSAALVSITSHSPAWKEMSPLAASGFRDVSRLASGNPEMQRDICLTNHAALTRWINDTIAFLSDMHDTLTRQDAEQLTALFAHNKQVRDAWLERQPDVRPGEEYVTQTQQIERRGLLDILFSTKRRNKS